MNNPTFHVRTTRVCDKTMCGGNVWSVCVVTYTLYFLTMLGQKMPQHTLARMFSLYTCNKSSCSNSLMIILTSKSLFCVVLSGPEVSSVFAAVLRSCMAVLVCGDNNMVSYFSSSCQAPHAPHTPHTPHTPHAILKLLLPYKSQTLTLTVSFRALVSKLSSHILCKTSIQCIPKAP